MCHTRQCHQLWASEADGSQIALFIESDITYIIGVTGLLIHIRHSAVLVGCRGFSVAEYPQAKYSLTVSAS